MRVLVGEKLSPHRFKTPEGYLICTDAILARTGKQTYRRREVFGDMSDKGEEEIEINRDAKEVFDPATLASFENKPLTIEHPNEDVNPENHHDYAVGFTRDIKRGKTTNGEDVMLGTIVVTDAEAIKDIESGELVELSCGYDCDVVDEANPQQRNIRGNHVALCERGRAGIARIVDSKVKDDALQKGKVYVARSGATLKVVDYECSFSDYNGEASVIITYDYVSASGNNKGRARANAHDFWEMLTDKSITGDSTKDVNDLTKFKMALRNISKMYSNDPGIEYVTSTLKNLGYEVTVDSIDGWKENKNVPGEHIKQYRMNVMLEGREHHFLVQLYADMGEWKVKEINAYMLDSNNTKQGDSMKDTKLQDKYVLYKEAGVWHGTNQENYEARIQNANAIQSFKAFSSVDAIISYLNKYGHLSKEDIIVKDSVNDEDFSKKTKQGFTVVEMYRDGGRLHAIVKRSSDYVVALGYDTSDGTWAQGRYVGTYGAALATLREEKPGAKKIQDCDMNDDLEQSSSMNDSIDDILNKIRTTQIKEGEQLTFEAEGYLIDIQSVGADRLEQRSDRRWASPRSSSHAWIRVWKDNQKVFDESGPINVARDRLIQFMKTRVNDSLKTFKVKYTKDSKTYIQKVKAKSITDAINKVKHCK